MKTHEIRCKNDNTLLITIEDTGDGRQKWHVPQFDSPLKTRNEPVPGKAGWKAIWATCPTCGQETLLGTMPIA